MKLLMGQFTCKNNHKFKAPGLFDYCYGHFFLRSEDRKYITQLDAITETVFNDISNFIQNFFPNKKDDFLRADIIQYVFGRTCDTSPDDSIYRIGLKPACPNCGIAEIKSWGETNPPEYIDIDVPHVTHNAWNKLSKAEQEKIIKEEINSFLGMKGYNLSVI